MTVEANQSKLAPIADRITEMDRNELRAVWKGLHIWRGLTFKARSAGEVSPDSTELLSQRFHESIELSEKIGEFEYKRDIAAYYSIGKEHLNDE
jgi:hypothetical protein